MLGLQRKKKMRTVENGGGRGGGLGFQRGKLILPPVGKAGGGGGVVKGVIATAKYASAVNGARVS